MEERSCQQETLRRENRKLAAMSWGPSDDLPPPKPLRYPMQGMLLINYICQLSSPLLY